jgi:all-trans-retinol 13,14-reductase
MPDKEFDVVIMGSGLGGLLCGYLLAEEGRSVCILEKNAQIGGNLQTFKRDRIKFDSGVHYVGGLEPGQALYPFFKYFDLLDHLESERLDSDGYDLISLTVIRLPILMRKAMKISSLDWWSISRMRKLD